MARLYRAASSIGNTKLFSYSAWFRIPSAGNPTSFARQEILRFGDDSDQDSKIYLASSTGTPPLTTLGIVLIGAERALVPPGNGTGWPTMDIYAVNRQGGGGGAANSSIIFGYDLWYWMGLSVDIVNSDIYDGGLGGPFVRGTVASLSVNRVSLFSRALTVDNGNQWESTGAGINWSYGQNQLYVGVPVYQYTVPTWDMVINGAEIGMPTNSHASGTTQQLKMEWSDIQVWFGTYLDFTNTAILNKFTQVVTGRGYPVDPAIAAASFGTQTILFKGKASDNSFFVNRGNGGAFTKIGTASDFTPTPSY